MVEGRDIAAPAPGSLSLLAPADGVLFALEELPDPVFAGKMLGDGIAIDPTSPLLIAPCAGRIVQIHRARHALTLRTDDGVSLLIHVGIDTVHLEGRGFRPLVSEGDRVTPGQPLLQFDLDAIAEGARSAVIALVITEGGRALTFKRTTGQVTAGAHEVLRLDAAAPPTAQSASAAEGELLRGQPVRFVNRNGLHARPAAQLSSIARRYVCQVHLHKGTEKASLTSVTDLMALDVAMDDTLYFTARGPQAAAAITALEKALAEGLGEDPAQTAPLLSERRFVAQDAHVLGGVAASPGLAIGRVLMRTHDVPELPATSEDPPAETARLHQALAATSARIKAQASRFAGANEIEKAQIFEAHAALLSDETLATEAAEGIKKGDSAARAWQQVIRARVDKLATSANPMLRQRTDDLKDIGHQVLLALLGRTEGPLALSKDSVMVCHELTPSLVALLDPGAVGALVTTAGGANSHAAIIARSMGLPYVASLGEAAQRLRSGAEVIVNGDEGTVRIEPDAAALRAARDEINRRQAVGAASLARAHEAATTRDGRRIEVAANIGNAKEAQQAVTQGCDGVGLLRSEFLFMGRRQAPTEAEQRAELEAIARTLGPQRTLIVRTLDVGGDKPLAYMPVPHEDNPFLGVRGVRLSFKYPELFIQQIRAIVAAAPHTQLHVMFPMIAKLDELKRAKEMVLGEARTLGAGAVKIGVMVEVPSAALMAAELANEVDFFSIGTNDLTQYTLAMDRGHPELSAEADALDPAVLRLIAMTVDAAHARGRWVGVCGGLAAQPLAVPLLVGLGIDELSVPPPAIAELKAQVRELTTTACQALARRALALPSSQTIRTLLQRFRDGTV